MPRQKKFDENHALVAAMHVFWDKGYEGTSLNDLEEATGLKRTSIYNAYGNKRQLFEKTIKLYQKEVFQALLNEMKNALTAKQGIKSLLEAVVNLHFSKQTPGGCMVALSLMEKTQHNQSTSELLENTLGFVVDTILNFLKLHNTHSDKSEVDLRTQASLVVTTMAGIMVQAKAGAKRSDLLRLAQCMADMF